MTAFNEIAPGGVGAPAEGVNPQPLKEGSSLTTVTPPGDGPVHLPLPDIALAISACHFELSVALLQLVENRGPLFATVDISAALDHLRPAIASITRAIDAIEADNTDHQAVAR